jgi:LemA protein
LGEFPEASAFEMTRDLRARGLSFRRPAVDGYLLHAASGGESNPKGLIQTDLPSEELSACFWAFSGEACCGSSIFNLHLMGIFLIGIAVVLGVALLIALAVGGLGVGIYNRLVALRNEYKNQFSQIDVQLKRRHDLIPNLVETAKGYMAHERGTLDEVTAARNGAAAVRQKAAADPSDPTAVQQVAAAEGVLTQSLGRLFAVAEAYPDLKANQNMLQVQGELTETENRISFARQAYNEAVRNFNTQREIFPNSVIAGMFNFAPASLFEITDPGEREVPKVSFT